MWVRLMEMGAARLDRAVLEYVAEVVEEALSPVVKGVSVDLTATIPMPDAAYDPDRRQYRAEIVLSRLRREVSRGRILVGLTGKDLYGSSLRFVFGQANPGGRVVVVSTYRLEEEDDEELFLDRLTTEIVHELGHVLGLKHCDDPGCVMSFSESIDDVDRKGALLCESCQGKLKDTVE